MADRWFRAPETEDDMGSKRPDLQGYKVDGFVGSKSHPDGAPHWLVCVYADEDTLNALADEPHVKALDNVPVGALNNMFGQNRNSEGWERGFNVQR